MTKPVTLTDPDPRFTEFIEKSNALDGAKLAAAIPKEYVQPSLARGLLGLAASLSVYVGAIVAMAVLDRWYLVVPLAILAGLGGWACTASHTSAGMDHSPEIAG
jgi:omega-6 fatty acid desaturase (delta-12 desaturase)